MTEWKRPATVPFPTLWHRFCGAKTNRKYWVQDITDEYMDKVLDLLCTQFMEDAPLCSHCPLSIDETTRKEYRDLWEYVLKRDRLGLLCLTEHKGGNIEIVGLNATARHHKDEPAFEATTSAGRYVINAVNYVCSLRDPHNELGIDSFLTAMGLLVLPKYRGENIGFQILRAREPMCRAVGIRASLTAFTGIASQVLATKAGFKSFSEMDYVEMEKVNSSFSFPGITKHTKALKYMYIMYE